MVRHRSKKPRRTGASEARAVAEARRTLEELIASGERLRAQSARVRRRTRLLLEELSRLGTEPMLPPF